MHGQAGSPSPPAGAQEFQDASLSHSSLSSAWVRWVCVCVPGMGRCCAAACQFLEAGGLPSDRNPSYLMITLAERRLRGLQPRGRGFFFFFQEHAPHTGLPYPTPRLGPAPKFLATAWGGGCLEGRRGATPKGARRPQDVGVGGCDCVGVCWGSKSAPVQSSPPKTAPCQPLPWASGSRACAPSDSPRSCSPLAAPSPAVLASPGRGSAGACVRARGTPGAAVGARARV